MGLELSFREPGEVPYEPTWYAMQRFVVGYDKSIMDETWLLQYPVVFTQGQAGKAEHVLLPGDVPVIQVNRSGQVTYHGPGQLVTYLLLDVHRLGLGVHGLVNRIEQSLVGLLASYDAQTVAKPDAPDVYVDGAKITFLSLCIRSGYSFHGLALNLDMDLRPFRQINPCDCARTPTAQLRDLVRPADFAEVCIRLHAELISCFGYAEQKTLMGEIELT